MEPHRRRNSSTGMYYAIGLHQLHYNLHTIWNAIRYRNRICDTVLVLWANLRHLSHSLYIDMKVVGDQSASFCQSGTWKMQASNPQNEAQYYNSAYNNNAISDLSMSTHKLCVSTGQGISTCGACQVSQPTLGSWNLRAAGCMTGGAWCTASCYD